MDSRALRYFVAVAEELNFTRAADRLGISPPPLSRAIAKLERDLGVPLLERSTHHVALTPAGTVLLTEARHTLDALDAAIHRTRRAGGPAPKLVLAVKADGDAGLLEPLLARYAATPAALPVTVRLCAWHEQPRLLRTGEADVALVHEPYDRTGLDAETLLVEPRVAALAATHPLAAGTRVTLADLGLTADGLPGFLDRVRAPGRDLAQVLALIALDEMFTLFPASVATRYPRPGVVYRPVVDAPPSGLAVAWPQRSRSTAVAALVRTAEEVAAAVREPRTATVS